MTVWQELLNEGDPSSRAERIAAHLDQLDREARVSFVQAISRSELPKLFDVCSNQPVAPTHFVGANRAPLDDVLHAGINSLPLFRAFEKRFCRLRDGTLCGYNPGPFNFAVTPGYFVVEPDTPDGLVFDYTRKPDDIAPGWPPPLSNEARLGRFVYGGLRDVMRRVSGHVSVGEVYRRGKADGVWFALCRMD